MDLTQTIKIERKTNDLMAHLAVVKSDVDNHVKILSDLNHEIKDALKRVQLLEEQEVRIKEGLDIRESKISEKEELVNRILASIEKDKEEINLIKAEKHTELREREKNISKAIRHKEDELNLATVNFERSKGMYESNLDLLSRSIDNLKDKIDEQDQLYILSRDRYEEAVEQLAEIESKVFDASDRLNQATTEVNNFIKENKTEVLKQTLIDRENAVAARERNLFILKSRLARVMDKLYPGQNVDNLI